MSIIDVSVLDRCLATSEDELRKAGVYLTTGYNFREFKEISKVARPSHKIGAAFDPDQGFGDGDCALWIAGRDKAGKVMHLQALRSMSIGEVTLAEYFRHNYRDYMPANLDIDFDRSRYRPGPGAKRISGNVVYAGEMWIDDSGRFRGTTMSNLLVRTTFLTALREFVADYIAVFMAQPLAHKGASVRMGFIHIEPNAVSLKVKGEKTPMQGYMAYMSAEDIKFVLDLPAPETDALAA